MATYPLLQRCVDPAMYCRVFRGVFLPRANRCLELAPRDPNQEETFHDEWMDVWIIVVSFQAVIFKFILAHVLACIAFIACTNCQNSLLVYDGQI